MYEEVVHAIAKRLIEVRIEVRIESLERLRTARCRAFATACLELDANDRALLRLHYVEGVTTASLANMYGISRSTLIRRLATARESLVNRVKAALQLDTGITEQDFDSVLRLVKSQIDLRLSMVLKQPA